MLTGRKQDHWLVSVVIFGVHEPLIPSLFNLCQQVIIMEPCARHDGTFLTAGNLRGEICGLKLI